MRHVATPYEGRYEALHRLGELGREIERRRGPDPYPRPTGPAPSLEALRRRRDDVMRIAARHGARTVSGLDRSPAATLDRVETWTCSSTRAVRKACSCKQLYERTRGPAGLPRTRAHHRRIERCPRGHPGTDRARSNFALRVGTEVVRALLPTVSTVANADAGFRLPASRGRRASGEAGLPESRPN